MIGIYFGRTVSSQTWRISDSSAEAVLEAGQETGVAKLDVWLFNSNISWLDEFYVLCCCTCLMIGCISKTVHSLVFDHEASQPSSEMCANLDCLMEQLPDHACLHQY